MTKHRTTDVDRGRALSTTPAQGFGPIRGDGDIARALDALRALDADLNALADLTGPLPLRLSPGGLPGLARIVTAQQVSTSSAAVIHGRLREAVDLADPAAVLDAAPETLRAAGLSAPKQRTLRALAEAIVEERLDLARVEAADAHAAIVELTAVPGIGPWTAQCYLLFCSGHPDVFPAGDLALQVAVAHAFALEERPSAKALAAMATRWAPHRSTAARLFWAYHGVIGRSDGAPVGTDPSA